MPPTEPAMPPMPTTEPTARLGNMSETSVNRLADQPWWAAAAIETSATAIHRLLTCAAASIGTTARAQTSIAVFRAALVDQPRLIRCDDSQPPPMLPTSATR